ncbi:DUF2207 domain-containing protein [Amycolatopsis rhabdoformis]|uniref:DUF2207 domain-containing protein n=1 Tax=Amycolatopsis rhabdoformis TaxID=1448059 RepID=A0ABZ1I6Q7_9PSEU|nr:DUF2207 domain-containing protein [Amycolatopsis rhabdoformis]WSE29553.1 DUF2207 domain-containing protein [Amycolatopsis rhabdoformis]
MLTELAVAVTTDATVHADGSITVTEHVTGPATHRIALRVPVSADEERVYTVRDARLTGAGHVNQEPDALQVTYSGPATLSYTVDGSVADGGLVRWPVTGGWDQDLTTLTATLAAPGISTVDCYAGAVGSARHCTFSELGSGGTARAEQDGLRRGDRVDLVVQVPTGALAATAKTVATAPVKAFFAGPGIPLVALLVLLAGAAATWRHRRRETRQRVLARA